MVVGALIYATGNVEAQAKPTSQDVANTSKANALASKPVVPNQKDISSDTKRDEKGNIVKSLPYHDDIRTLLQTLAEEYGVTIRADESVKSGEHESKEELRGELVDDTIESALDKITAGYFWIKKAKNVYLVSAGGPKDSFFNYFAKVKSYRPANQNAETISLLVSPSIQPYVTVDKSSNSLLITAPEKLVPQIEEMLRQIDSRARQFEVEAMITELNGGTSADYGFSWNWHNFGVDSGLNLNYARATTTDIVTLKNLIGKNRATLRANPRVSAFEGKETLLNVGTETYYTIQTGVLTYQATQLQVIKTGVTLKVIGFLDDEGYVTMKITAEVGDFTTPVSGYPTVTTRKGDTNVRVKSGETIVIGGLIQDTDTNNATKVPLLGNLPLVGKLFQQKSTARKRTKIVMMITPRISDKGASTNAISQDLPIDPERPQPPPLPMQKGALIQIHCGKEEITGHKSGVWQADRYFIGGHINSVPMRDVTNTNDRSLYNSYRSGASKFQYAIPVPNGKYELNLGFVEMSCTEAGQRLFDVTVNGTAALHDLDVFNEAGGQAKILTKKVSVIVTDGMLHIDFQGKEDYPIISTIQVLPHP